ncbi:penicillin acylase family protein [Humitalea sp. 24SJ18S-53]|uniref:penicillin acylase family protein n=1 Tax=Humitalea sp. 24SJ18S-53 TaxID=3422307 RepID=UPI003D670BAD
MRILFRFLGAILRGGFVLLLLLAALVGGLLWLTLPGTPDRLALPGLSAPVALAFDDRGIPTITAAGERDAAMALGWLHARDRMFQMEMMRRGASGRLAELVGPPALRLDRLSRTLGLRLRAEADLAVLPAETRDLLDAYAAGVNAWIGARGRFSAPEFILLGSPEPWVPSDSLLWGKVMGLWLSGSWRGDLARARAATVLRAPLLADLWPDDDGAGRADLAGLPALGAARLARLHATLPEQRLPEAPLPATASNAWAVVPGRSTTGGALLASDPHLGFQAPILWYLAKIALPGDLPGGRVLTGATAPGVPFMVIGRNDRLAWGFTTTHGDVQDVFVETLVGTDAYMTPDGPMPFEVREETIRTRGRAPEVLRVRETRHGPVVSDLDQVPAETTVIAVAMANLAPADTSAAGLHALNRARDLPSARAAAALISSPPQNLMVADATGEIALYLTGRYPVRRSGDGRVPADGADGARDWIGWIDFDDLPHVERPASGQLVNANDRVSPPGDAAFLGADWPGDWRARRIRELLAERQRHAPGDFAAMQVDAVSLMGRESAALLLSLPRPDGLAGAARDLLTGWDGTAAVDRPQPLIANAFWRRFAAAALAAQGAPEGSIDPTPEFARVLLRADTRAAAWCGADGCAAMAGLVFQQTIAALAERHGPDPATWRWGAVHVARFDHPLLRFVPVIGPLVRIEATTPGDGETVNRGGVGAGFAHVQGAGLRFVADLSTPDGAWAAIATGQSGHPLSRHWSDRTAGWAAGRMERIGR